MKTSSQPLVSIVTPAYNEEAYLAECIESVLSQTYQNWDYTIVDNCSTDGSLAIASWYAAKDRRIRVERNRGFMPVIPNHNAAVRHISPTSKFCKIVFADDWMFPDCLDRMVAVAEEHPSVGIVGSYRLEGRDVKCTGLPYPSTVVGGKQICREYFLKQLYVFGSPSNLLYRSELVRSHDPFYNEGTIHADTETCFALLKTSDLGFVHQVLTFTRLRPSSLRSTSTTMALFWATMLRLLVSYGPDCLTEDELKACVEDHLSAYYRFLGKNLACWRDQEFWEYHKRGLADSGIGYSRIRLAKGAVVELCDALLNPKQTIEKLLRIRGDLRLTGGRRTFQSESPTNSGDVQAREKLSPRPSSEAPLLQGAKPGKATD